MADLISDGNTKVAWATSIANIAAPTVAELTAASDWTQRITPDGLKVDPTTADVNTSSLASTFDTNQPGRTGYACELTFKRGSRKRPTRWWPPGRRPASRSRCAGADGWPPT